jgi:hypothetical protein
MPDQRLQVDSNARYRIAAGGETCWRQAEARRLTMLVDGAAYFGALRSSMLKAKRRIVIVGWVPLQRATRLASV